MSLCLQSGAAQKLYNPEVYARINILIQRTFSSGYALKLYENCIRYRGTGSTGWWSIDTFKTLLGLSTDEYEKFKDLNKWIIKPSLNQINQHSDILIEAEYKRQKRRIVALRFHVKTNPQLSIPLSIRNQLLSEGDSTALLELNQELAKDTESPLVRLQKFGFTEKQAQAALKKYGDVYVMENLDIVERDYLAGKVQTLPAYTRSALQADYRPKLSRIEQAQHQGAVSVREQTLKREKASEALEHLQRDFRRARLQAALEQISPQEHEVLRTRFQEANQSNPLFRRWFRQGFDHPVIQSLFRAFVSEELLTETDEDEFDHFVNEQGYELNTLRREAGVAVASVSSVLG
ncbi:MAG: replication initiation protein [Candidatus Competibacteraceae bacterium]